MNRHSIRKRLIVLLLVPIASLLYFGSTSGSTTARCQSHMPGK